MAGNPMPAAELAVTADLVRRLLAAQHPDLAHLPVRFLANGWDNVMFRGRVIDFGDITSGDPAADLAVAWMLLPAGWHGAFRDAYLAAGRDPIDDALWARARGWALNLALVFLAHSADNPQLLSIGRGTLRAVLG